MFVDFFIDFLTIFNSFFFSILESIFHKALNLFQFDCEIHVICSWNQPVLSNKGKVSCSRKQLGQN